MSKKFIGYLIMGAASEQDAVEEKGLLLWSTKRPNGIVRFFNRVLLNVRWVDKSRALEDKGQKTHPDNGDVKFRKTYPPKYKQKE